MPLLDQFERVTRSRPCPICGKPDYCLIELLDADEVASAICPRTPSSHRWGGAGYWHPLGGESRARTARSRVVSSSVPTARTYDVLAAQLAAAADDDFVHREALQLGVSVGALRRLTIGHASGHFLPMVGLRGTRHAATFPMEDGRGRVVGLRLRLPGGRKRTLKGSRLGAFVPEGLSLAGTLFVAEGESDTAALLTLGVDAIGRPGASVCEEIVVRAVKAAEPRRAVVVADPDAVGRRGAISLARRLAQAIESVLVVEPPGGDVRDWVRHGGTRADLLDLVRAAERGRS